MLWKLQLVRRVGALSLLAVGAVHLQQYVGADYRAIPTIGWLFLLNAIGAGVVGILLLAPLERSAGRVARLAEGMLSATGSAIAIGSLIALFISESGSLFGFSESGYRAAIVVAIIAEVLTVGLLTPVAATRLGRARVHGRRRGDPEVWSSRVQQPHRP